MLGLDLQALYLSAIWYGGTNAASQDGAEAEAPGRWRRRRSPLIGAVSAGQ